MFIIACIFLACLSLVDSSTGNRCDLNATFYFVEDETPNITCSGFVVGYWSLIGPSTGGQEIRIGDCSNCPPVSACSCKTDTTDYSITQNGTTNVILFVNNLPANNRSIIRCSAENNSTCGAISINIIKAPARCQHADNCIDIVEDQPTPVTCKGAPDKDIYWSITHAATPETRIGDCSKCKAITQLPCDCQIRNGDFNITRTGHTTKAVSILQFLSNVETNDNSTIKCSTSDDTVIVSVSINVIPAYRLPACSNNKIVLHQNSKGGIRCEGMERRQNMYWSITYPGKTERTVAECGYCGNSVCPPCDVKIGDFSVERSQTFSVLRLTGGNDRDKDGAVVKCSKLNNATHDQCTLSSSYYTLTQCRNGQLHISEAGKRLPVTCDGVGPGHSVNWTLTDDSGHVTPLSLCTGRDDCTTNDDVTASRTDNASILTFVDITGLRDNLTLTCARSNGGTKASCRIRTFKNDITKGEKSKLSVVVVAGGVGAAVVVTIVVIVVIVAVVVFRRRRDRQAGPSTADSHRKNQAVYENTSGVYYLTHVASHTTQQEDRLPYDGLRMTEVGLRSEYSDVGSHGNVSSKRSAENPYEGLRWSDVGLTSEYSVVGDRSTST